MLSCDPRGGDFGALTLNFQMVLNIEGATPVTLVQHTTACLRASVYTLMLVSTVYTQSSMINIML
jgi:hypothetical protein